MTSSSNDERLNRLEAIVENLALSVTEERNIAKARLDRTDAQISQLTRNVAVLAQNQQATFEIIQGLNEERNIAKARLDRTDAQISQLTRNVAVLAQNQPAMFEIIQGLNEDRVKFAENLASIAESLARLSRRDNS